MRRAGIRLQVSGWNGGPTNGNGNGNGRVPDGVALPHVAGSLLAAQEEERRRVSRELHDELGQKLALLEIQLVGLERLCGSHPRAASRPEIASELRSLRGRVAEISGEVHRICYHLHPAVLEHLGLFAALESFCNEFTEWSGVKVRFIHSDVPAPLPKNVSLCLYRVVQEALHNVAKHAAADRAIVALRGVLGGIQVIVKDTGRGFDLMQARNKGGLGLISICERVRLAGGRCSIRSAPGHGTRVAVCVPIGLEA